MNKTKHVVEEILSEPEYNSATGRQEDGRKVSVDWWEVQVIANSHGKTSKETWTFDTEEEANALEVGDSQLR